MATRCHLGDTHTAMFGELWNGVEGGRLMETSLMVIILLLVVIIKCLGFGAMWVVDHNVMTMSYDIVL